MWAISWQCPLYKVDLDPHVWQAGYLSIWLRESINIKIDDIKNESVQDFLRQVYTIGTKHECMAIAWWRTGMSSSSTFEMGLENPLSKTTMQKVTKSFHITSLNYSASGSNQREKEERTTVHWSGSSLYPMASTCALEMFLPTCWASYEEFKSGMIKGIVSGFGFGQV